MRAYLARSLVRPKPLFGENGTCGREKTAAETREEDAVLAHSGGSSVERGVEIGGR